MPKIKYYYDPNTCKYEKVKITRMEMIFDGIMTLSIILFAAICIVVVYMNYYDSPKEISLRKENEKLHFYYNMLGKEIQKTSGMLAKLQERDDGIYRTIYEQDPIPESIRNAGIGGAERYNKLIQAKLSKEELILSTVKDLDQIKRKMYIQTKSYDELLTIAKSQHLMLASIPAIAPITTSESYLSSGFGPRYHPIYKVKKMHTGLDFAARVGTSIYATGGGTVTKVSSSYYGYGKQVEIDHGFGFKTKYAHMSEFNVKVGQKVKRGECIGYSGNTGTSSGPHLHYEVFKNRNKVNPIHYIYRDISEEEYEMLVKLASIENQSM
ncbi:M23 family metallopeptidase [Catalinimonas niigatensis]|uniref:M23 family metallopeptidase n=1 Tax=Catalinimonas niigatensis TaxID=1397264 RepID=UPI002665E730|nr:M23 family metallopeptidase [Catalinimonas niigatensis]WPP50551.1 M23 family metallopeptidase [Catalinimonas niigatensis]